MDVQPALMIYDELETCLRCSGVAGWVFIVPKLVPDSRFPPRLRKTEGSNKVYQVARMTNCRIAQTTQSKYLPLLINLTFFSGVYW